MKKNKYNAKKTQIDGITFDSKAESLYYIQLKLEKEKGLIKDFSLQPKFELIPKFEKNGVKYRATTYKADFKVINNDDRLSIIDIKGGKLTKEFTIKRKLFELKYNHLTLTLLKREGNTFVFHEQN